MEAVLIVAGLLFGAYQIRSVKKFNKKLNRAKAKGVEPLDKFS